MHLQLNQNKLNQLPNFVSLYKPNKFYKVAHPNKALTGSYIFCGTVRYLSHCQMDSSQKSGEMAINITESKSTRGKAAAVAPATIIATTKGTENPKGGWKRGVGVFDFILRICAIGAALAATATMGTTDQTLPFFTQFLQFQASYDDLPAFTYPSTNHC